MKKQLLLMSAAALVSGIAMAAPQTVTFSASSMTPPSATSVMNVPANAGGEDSMEETGLEVDSVRLVFTDWFAKKELMMIGFFAHARCRRIKLSSEVDSAEWVEASMIKDFLSPRPESTSRRLALHFLNEREV